MKYQLLYNIEMSLFITSGTITAQFKQNLKEATLQIIFEQYMDVSYLTYKITPSNLKIEADFKVTSTIRRDDGSSDTDIAYITYNENQKFEYSYFYDDGYGNSENSYSELLNFKITENGKTIYSGSEEPEDGTISNGYKFSIIK